MQLALNKVSTSYDQGSSWALQNVTLTIEQGEFLGIAGPTGSGKSTLIQHLNGLLTPTKGTIELDGQTVSDKKSRRSLKGRVGLAFQYPEQQLFAQTVLEDVAFGPKNLGLSQQEATERARYALEQVGLSPSSIEKKSPFGLSGGEQRRAALAGILAMQPEVLVLDEPAAGLDPTAHAAMIELLAQLNRTGMTIVMTSHDMDDLAQLSSRIVVLANGSVIKEGAPAKVFASQEELERIGLSLPFAQHFANRLKARGVQLPCAFYPTIDALSQDLARCL